MTMPIYDDTIRIDTTMLTFTEHHGHQIISMCVGAGFPIPDTGDEVTLSHKEFDKQVKCTVVKREYWYSLSENFLNITFYVRVHR